MTMPTIESFSATLNARWDASLRANPTDNIAIPAMGLCGEASEAAAEVMMASGRASEHFKKYIRDGAPIVANLALAYELGDVLHYWCRLVHLTGYSPSEIMHLNEVKLEARRAARQPQVRKRRLPKHAKRFPHWTFRSLREFQAQKRRDFKALKAAVDRMKMGVAFVPGYVPHWQQLERDIKRIGEAMHHRSWK